MDVNKRKKNEKETANPNIYFFYMKVSMEANIVVLLLFQLLS